MDTATPQWKRILAEAAWLNARRLKAYPTIFLSIYAIAIVLYLLASPALVDPLNRPVGTDFMNFWAAGKMALDKDPAGAYDWNKHRAVQEKALPWKKGLQVPYFPWNYPPMFLMAAAVLALLPYGVALLLWMVLTLPAYLATINAILPRCEALLAALAFPAVIVNLGHGQNGFLTASLLGGGIMLLETKPCLAGVLFGLLAYKPQFGLLIPLALLLGWRWRVIVSTALTIVLTAAASYTLFGYETWQAFFGSLKLTRIVVLEHGGAGWEKLQSMFAAVRLWDGNVQMAYGA